MKKIYLFIVMALIGSNVYAQDNGFGVRAGVNIASMTNYNSKVGLHVGGMYRLQLSSNVPVFFEPGVMFQLKGGKLTQSGVSSTLNLAYVEVPAVFAYQFQLNETWAIQPALGPYFAFGIGGKSKDSYSYEGVSQEEEYDIFGDDGAKRFDFGLGVGAALEFGKMFVGLDGLFGLTKMYDGDGAPKNTTIALSVGYKF